MLDLFPFSPFPTESIQEVTKIIQKVHSDRAKVTWPSPIDKISSIDSVRLNIKYFQESSIHCEPILYRNRPAQISNIDVAVVDKNHCDY